MIDEDDMSDIEYHLEWRKVALRSQLVPSLKANSASVSFGSDIYLFGGQGAGQLSDVWMFSYEEMVWKEVLCTSDQIGDVPSARDGHTMVKISDTKLIVYAGQGGLFDSGKCERATEHGKVKYLFMRKLLDDMYELDISTRKWTEKPRRKVRPLGRRGHSMAHLKPKARKMSNAEDRYSSGSGLGNLLLFGGSCLDTSTGFEKVSSDVWLYSLSEERWMEKECSGTSPRAVYGHSAVLMNDDYVIIGGCYAPPRREGFLSKAKAMAPKEKVSNSFSSKLSDCADGYNTVSILNTITFQWSYLNIDCIAPDLDTPAPELHITGHTSMKNPLKKNEILIFGGRAVDDSNEADVSDVIEPAFVPAKLFTLSLDECTLSYIDVQNDPFDSVNVPSARLHHVCQRNIDGHIVLNYNRDAKSSKKMKNGRKFFDIAASTRKVEGQPVTLVYGGVKACSPGFCDHSVYELYFVPHHDQKKKESSDINLISSNTSMASLLKDEHSHVSRFSMDSLDGKSKSLNRSSSKSVYDNASDCSLRALKLKDDCSTQLLSPKRGVDGHYFDLKSSLSFSRSKLVPSWKIGKSPESDAGDNFSSLTSLADDDEDISLDGSSVLSAQRVQFMSSKEILKAKTQELAPKTRGMTIHHARSVYRKLYPLPGAQSKKYKLRQKK